MRFVCLVAISVGLMGCNPKVESLEKAHDGTGTNFTITVACRGADRERCKKAAGDAATRECPTAPLQELSIEQTDAQVKGRWRCHHR